MARSSSRKRPENAKERKPAKPEANAGAPESRASTAERERRFVQHYFSNGLNGVKAAIDAGFSPNYATAAGMASRLLRRPSVLKLIEAERAKEGDYAEEQRRRQVERLEAIAYADPRELYNEHGAFKPMRDLDDVSAALVGGIRTREEKDGEGEKVGDVVEVKLRDQLRAHEILAKVQGFIVDRHEHSGKGGAPLVVEVVKFAPKGKR